MELPNPPPPYQGNFYFLYPAEGIQGAVHAKVTLTVDELNLLCLLGSHNLT